MFAVREVPLYAAVSDTLWSAAIVPVLIVNEALVEFPFTVT
jgi:hypothetical protein